MSKTDDAGGSLAEYHARQQANNARQRANRAEGEGRRATASLAVARTAVRQAGRRLERALELLDSDAASEAREEVAAALAWLAKPGLWPESADR